MKTKLVAFMLPALTVGSLAFADDGELVRKTMSSSPGQTIEGPLPEAEEAFIDMMSFYVPAQASSGDQTIIDYYNVDGALQESRGYAKPLIGVYVYGPVVGVEGTGFAGHGMRDAYAAVSLDDGVTWKRTNLSESANLSSFETTVPFPDPGSESGESQIEYDPDGPVIETAEWDPRRFGGRLEVEGDAGQFGLVTIRNAVTQERLFFSLAWFDGEFDRTRWLREAPCAIQAGIRGVYGPPIEVEGAPEDCEGSLGVPQITEYPGDVVGVFQATDGKNTIAVWPSRYCSSGKPNYSLETSDAVRREAIADYMGIDLENPSPDDLYLIDMYGVGGQQGSVDYSEDRFEPNQAVGEVPYSCLWAARGVLVQGDDPRTEASEASYMRWFKAERLTSGRRDVNRIEAQCVAGAGCAVTWQEDPEGLRPGQGEGPGEGWSGAIANSQTDVWYSYISWQYFDLVENSGDPGSILTFDEYLSSGDTTKPQVGIPMAVPMRVTDNARCNVTNPQPYCNGSAISANFPDLLNPLDYGLPDMCADTVQIPTGQQGNLSDICVTENGLPLVGNIAATRPRLGVHGYDSDGIGGVDSAWVLFEAEESKGLGAFGFTDTTAGGAPCDPEVDENCIAFDEGKNLWYYSFGMSLTDASATDPDYGLLANLAGHGNQLNQPEVNWQTGEFYPPRSTASMWDFGSYNYEIYNTEIARRGSLLAQDQSDAGPSGLVALPAWKQGIMNQGGPADVMVRRIVDQGYATNPYAFVNMACDNWVYQDGSNPHYPDGLCLDPAINLSGVVPDSCTDSETGEIVTCPQVDLTQGTSYGIGDTNPVLQGLVQGEGNTTKVLSWHQCPSEFTTISGETQTCADDARTDDSNLSDQSWYNPLDVAKGHRGFLDGDFVMMLYAWSPNWRLNAKGNDRYELYIRRSFDGGASWTNLPSSFTASDGESYSGAGNVTCETFRSEDTQAGGDLVEPRVCNQYAAGAPEQARNVTQHRSMRTTTLDPRYTPTADTVEDDPFGFGYAFTDEDTRDPSRYFIVYETGDNTTTAEGEPEPEDLFLGRAVQFGDNYQIWAEEDDLSVCYPSDPHGDDSVAEELIGSGFCNEFEQLDQGIPGLEASESSLASNPGGEFAYAVWTQALHDEDTGELEESDAIARRVWFLDDYISEAEAWVLPGTSGGNN